MGITEDTAGWPKALFSASGPAPQSWNGARLGFFAVGSEDVSLASLSGILSFYMVTALYLFVRLL